MRFIVDCLDLSSEEVANLKNKIADFNNVVWIENIIDFNIDRLTELFKQSLYHYTVSSEYLQEKARVLSNSTSLYEFESLFRLISLMEDQEIKYNSMKLNADYSK